MCNSFLCALTLLWAGPLRAETPPADTPAAADFRALSAEYDKLYTETRLQYRAEKDDGRIDDAARKYRAKVHDLGVVYASRFLELAEKHPSDAVAVAALVRAAQLGEGETPDSEKALRILERRHLADPGVQPVISDVAYAKWAGADKFLRAVLDKNSSRQARGLAAYWLAYRLRQRSDEELTGPEADKAFKEAENLLQLVIARYADVPGGGAKPGTLGERAALALGELQRLQIGKVAPEIDGEDGAGRHFKLSDYRGKVVVLDFWGHWCPDCRAVYPRQRALAKRLEGKPFALIGINSDENRDQLRTVLDKRGVTWRYWWDGGSRSGPIASAWNIQGWPTIYILDAKGVIRHKGHEELAEKLDQLVDELLKEAEGASAR